MDIEYKISKEELVDFHMRHVAETIVFKYQNLFEETKLTITEEGLKINTQFVEKIYNWNSIKSIHLVENYILIRTVNNEDLLIPIFLFKHIEDKQAFLDTIIRNTDLELQKQYPKDIKYL